MGLGLINYLRNLPSGFMGEWVLGSYGGDECVGEGKIKLSVSVTEDLRALVVYVECMDQDEDDYVKPMYQVYIYEGKVEEYGELPRGINVPLALGPLGNVFKDG